MERSVTFMINLKNRKVSLFQEEISASAAVHMRYVMDACNRV